MMKAILKVVLFVGVSLFMAGKSFAECMYTAPGGYARMTIDLGEINVPRDLPVGGVIKTVTSRGYPSLFACTQSYQVIFRVAGGPFATPVPNMGGGVYQTNISGIGLFYEFRPAMYPGSSSVGYNLGLYIKVLKVSEPVGNGPLTQGKLYEINATTPVFFKGAEMDLAGGTVNSIGCSLKTPNLTFPLDPVNQAQFGSSVGFMPATENTQDLGFECDPGVNVNVMLSGTQNPDVTGDTSVLALTGQGSNSVAKGVGIKLFYGAQPLKLNENLVLGTSPAGLVSYALKAKYYQTKPTVTAGSASATATLAVTYQ